MAAPLIVEFHGAEISLDLEKVDRSDLYGYVDVETLDDLGRPCRLVTLAPDGRTLIGAGGTAFGYLSIDGLWLDRDVLQPVDVNGQVLQPVPSSFSARVPLTQEQQATIEELLDHNIRSVYMLSTGGEWSGLKEGLAGGAIYRFPFSYRGGLNPDVAFMLQGADGNVFLLVGSPTAIEYAGLAEAAAAVEEEGEPKAEDEDLDFAMF